MFTKNSQKVHNLKVLNYLKFVHDIDENSLKEGVPVEKVNIVQFVGNCCGRWSCCCT